MEIKQIATLVNQATNEVLGTTDILQEDLGNVVDVGTEVFNANAVDSYVKALVNHIGKVIFVNRPYRGRVPSVLMDGWEFGSVLEKIHMSLPQAEENESWDLVDNATYEENIFYKPIISAKFFNKKVTFEIPMSITEMQVKQSFSNAQQLNGFISMIYSAIDKSMNVKLDSLIMRTINNFTAHTLYNAMDEGGENYDEGTFTRAINLLYLYNQDKTEDEKLSVANALKNADFLKFASYTIALYMERLGTMSTLFNIGGTEKFTPKEDLHVVLLSEFAKASEVYLESDTYHNELVKLENYEVVPYWQGSGTTYNFNETSFINVKTADGEEVELNGILGVMFDRDALGVANMNRRTTTKYNAKAEFFNNWYKMDAHYFNDFNENFIVFYIQ